VKINIDFDSIVNHLVKLGIVAAILTSAGAIWEFQGVKAKVKNNESRLDVVSKIVCMYATRDKLKGSAEICYEVIKGAKNGK
jgi:hypothetical protein